MGKFHSIVNGENYYLPKLSLEKLPKNILGTHSIPLLLYSIELNEVSKLKLEINSKVKS